MNEPQVKLVVDGTEHTGWITVNIRRSLIALSGSFELGIRPVDRPVPKGWKIAPHRECQILLGDTPVITGFIESIQSELNKDHHVVHVRGRDKTADLIDCPSGQGGKSFQKVTFKKILESLLMKFDIEHDFEFQSSHLHPAFHVSEFEGVFSALSRLAALDGLLLTTDGEGRLVITRPRLDLVPQEIISEALACEYSIDVQGMYSEYDMFIPNYAENYGNSVNESKLLAHSSNESVARFRPYTISSEGYANAGSAQKRVDWENSVRAAKGEKLKLTLPTWISKGGKLWEVNVPIKALFPALGIDGKFLISDVTFKLDQSGHQTVLECVPANAFKADPTLFIKENNLKDLITKESK
jgi:prophage tail gpP-like protein